MQSEMLHFSPVMRKKTRTFPKLLLHTAARGARQVGGRTGNIPPTHRNGVHVLLTGDHLSCGSLWSHQLRHLGLCHCVIGDAPQWPGIILDLNEKKAWNSNKELGKIDRNGQQIL